MKNTSRRSFLQRAAAVPAAFAPHALNAKSIQAPIGLQLYTVGKEMDADPFGTLKRVAAVGYKNVELSPLAKVPLADLKKGLD